MTRMSRHEAQMFEGQVEKVVRAFYPGLSSVTWVHRQQASALLSKCKTIVDAFQAQLSYYLTVNQKLSSTLMEAKELVLFTKNDEVIYENEGFQEDLELQRAQAMKEVKDAFLQMEQVLDNLNKKMISKSIPESVEAWTAYVFRIDNLFLDCQREILRKSLLMFEGMLMGSRSCPTEQLAPVFKISVRLLDGKIVCTPSVSRISEAVSQLQKVFSESLSKIPCLLRKFALEKAKEHDHLAALQDEMCDKLQTKLTEEFEKQVNTLKGKLEEWQQYRDLWEVDKAEFFQHYLSCANSVYIFETDIMTFERKLNEIEGSNDNIKVGTFYANCEELKVQLSTLCRSWISEFENNLFKIASEKLDTLYSYGQKTNALLDSDPQDIPSLLTAADECHLAKKQLALYREEFTPVREQFHVLKKYRYVIPSDVDDRLAKLEKEWDSVEAALTNKIHELNTDLNAHRKKFSDRSEIVMEEVDALKQFFKQTLPTRVDKTIPEAKENLAKLKEMMDDIVSKLDINENLELLSLQVIEFSELTGFQHDLVAAEKIWLLLEEWQITWEKWADLVVWEVSVVALQEMLSVYSQKIRNIQPFAALNLANIKEGTVMGESEWEVKEEVLSHIELCKLLVPLTQNLQTANLKSHHWDQIKYLVKADIDKDSESFTLGYLQKLNLTSYKRELADIMVDASEETKIVNNIRDIESLASQITIDMRAIPSMGISVVQSTVEANSTIAELNMRLQILAGSHHAKPYLDEVQDIQKMLSSMISFLENVELLQKKWSAWEPFFHVMDVRFHLVQATASFDSLNDRWRQVSDEMSAEKFLQPLALQDELQEEVIGVSEGLNSITNQIKPYLQDRREQFSRFWLLSDDDLVTAISIVLDGEHAKPFLLKMFTTVAKIKQEKNSQLNAMEVIGVYSKEGEFLELNSYVPILGSFDTWLRNMSSGIENTLREGVKQCRNSMKIAGVRVDEVIKLWPLQVNVVAFLLHWTSETSRALAKFKGHMNAEQLQSLKKRVRDSQVRLDSSLQGNLSKLMRERFRLFYLIILQLRDFLTAASESRKGLTSEGEMPLRYTWDKDSDNVLTQFGASSELTYSWEYQGLWPCTVFTPSINRAMVNVALVLAQGLAVGLHGGNGSGKTEIIRAMANLVGRHLVSVTCAPTITSVHLARLLLGTSLSHSWLVLEQAHLLNPDVVPALGEMIQTMQAAQKAVAGIKAGKPSKSQQQPIKVFEGVKVNVSPLSAVVLEMNHNYPFSRDAMDILRRQCRPAVTVTPDIQVYTTCFVWCHRFIINV